MTRSDKLSLLILAFALAFFALPVLLVFLD
jgi:hypothetical protein